MAPDPCVTSSPRIALDVTGTPRSLTADIIVSAHQGNAFQNRGDGAYVPGEHMLSSAAFPSTPDDGMLVCYEVSPGALWRFRYNAGSSATYKWEFAGGGDWFDSNDNLIQLTVSGGNTWVTGATGGPSPSLAVPFNGVYEINFGAFINAAQAPNAAEVGVSIGGNDPTDDNVAATSDANGSSVSRIIVPSGVTAGTVFVLRYRDAGSGTTNIRRRWMTIRPRNCG